VTDALSERALGQVGLSGLTVALGWAQFGAHCFSNYFKTAQILYFKFVAFPNSKNIQSLQSDRFEHD
jgi:hypothetical protein